MTNKPVGKLALHTEYAGVGRAVRGLDSNNFSLLHQEIHLAAYAAVRTCCSSPRQLPAAIVFTGFGGQGTGGAGRDAVTAGDTAAVLKDLAKGQADGCTNTPVPQGEGAVTLNLIAGANAAAAENTLGRIVVEKLAGLVLGPRLLGPFETRLFYAVVHGQFVQFTAAHGGAGETVSIVIGQKQFNDDAPKTGDPFIHRRYLHALAAESSAGELEVLDPLDFNSADSARSSGARCFR